MPASSGLAERLVAPARPRPPRVVVGCPDARPPAYEAAAGFATAGRLDRFLTGFYYKGPGGGGSLRRRLQRRQHPGIPAARVDGVPSFDVALAVENRLSRRGRGRVARWRTRRFDRQLARMLDRRRPDVALVFSDVGSEFALPMGRRRGVRMVVSQVCGDVREERDVIAREREQSPEFFPIYLADGPIDEQELAWLHGRRLRDIELADRVLVPSEHIAERLLRHGTPPDRVRVLPYAADTRRFVPRPGPAEDRASCTFLFAGGITQRKGIGYLLRAWRAIRRPGWRLQLLGGLPADPAPLEPYRDEVEWLGRVGHADVASKMAAADVFVFPSLFEGSAVVTYEALACGLPSIVTPSAGSVVRDGLEGLVVPPGEAGPLAGAMERLGRDADLRAEMALAARRRAEAFDWPRYQAGLVRVVDELAGR